MPAYRVPSALVADTVSGHLANNGWYRHKRHTRARQNARPYPVNSADYGRTFTLDPLSNNQIQTALGASCTDDTAKKNWSNVRQFVQFCKDRSVPREHVFPASENLMCAYAASFMGRLAGATVRGKVSAVKGYHTKKGLPWSGGDKLRKVVKGVENATPLSSVRPQRPPVTVDMLRILHQDLNPRNGFDTAVLAVAVTSFYGQLRLGEVLPGTQNPASFDNSRHPSLAGLSEPFSAAGSRRLHLPWSKTKRSRGEDVVISRQRGRTDPISALGRHIRINKLSNHHPLASYRDKHNKLVSLTKQKFLRRCNAIWRKHGIQRFTGHSFRIGGTTHYLLVGVSPDVVKTFGRWSSDAFLRYWRSLDSLASMHIEMLKDKYTFA